MRRHVPIVYQRSIYYTAISMHNSHWRHSEWSSYNGWEIHLRRYRCSCHVIKERHDNQCSRYAVLKMIGMNEMIKTESSIKLSRWYWEGWFRSKVAYINCNALLWEFLSSLRKTIRFAVISNFYHQRATRMNQTRDLLIHFKAQRIEYLAQVNELRTTPSKQIDDKIWWYLFVDSFTSFCVGCQNSNILRKISLK